jgi:hypothetical protein
LFVDGKKKMKGNCIIVCAAWCKVSIINFCGWILHQNQNKFFFII